MVGLWNAPLLGQVDESLRIDNAGLVAYNRVTDRLGDVPVSVVYLRGDLEQGRVYLWPRLEPEPGRYDFSPFLTALEEAERIGVKVGLRIMTAHPRVPRDDPDGSFFPDWIPYREVTRNGQTAVAPDWDDPVVQASIRDLLMALGRAVRDHPAFLFADVGVLGWVGEWHTLLGFKNTDFMPTLQHQQHYIDFHIEAFGADKLLLQLVDMKPELLAYGLKQGIRGIRQDCFGSTYHMQQYEQRLFQVPELIEAIEYGMVFFEVCGPNMADWTHRPDDPFLVTLPIEQIFERALRWRCTLYANLGQPIPNRYLEAYSGFQRQMITYLPK